jgi:hypothetical protein
VRGVRGDAGGGAGADGVRLPGLRHAAVAPAGSHAGPAAAAAEGAAPPPGCRGRARGAAALRLLRRAPERPRRAVALRLPALRRRARRLPRAAPELHPVLRRDGRRAGAGAGRPRPRATHPRWPGGGWVGFWSNQMHHLACSVRSLNIDEISVQSKLAELVPTFSIHCFTLARVLIASPSAVMQAWQRRPNSAVRSGFARAEADDRLFPLERSRIQHPDRLIHLQQDEEEYPDGVFGGEEAHEIVSSNIQQRNRCSVEPGIVSVKNRLLPIKAARHQVHDQRSSYGTQRKPAQLARLHRVIHSEEVQEGPLSHEVYREASHAELIYETATTHSNRRIMCSVAPEAVGSVDKRRIEHDNQITQKRQKHTAHAIRAEHTQVGCLDGAIHAEEAQPEPVDQANHGEEGCIQVIDKTTARGDSWKSGCSVRHNTVSAGKRKTSTADQVTKQTQTNQSYANDAEHAQIEHPDQEIHEDVSQTTHREAMCFRPRKDSSARHSEQDIVHVVDPKNNVNKRQIEPLSHVIQHTGHTSDINNHAMQVDFDPQSKHIGRKGKPKTGTGVDSNLTLKNQDLLVSPNQLSHINQKHMPPNHEAQKKHINVENCKQPSSQAREKNRKGLMASSNSSLHLRRSKRLAKDSVAVVENEPVENDPVDLQVSSPNCQVSAVAMSSEPIEQEPILHQSPSPNCEVLVSTTDAESVESEHHEHCAFSPHQSMSDPPDIDRIIAGLCPSTSSVHEKPREISSEPDDPDLATTPSNPDMSDPERFAQHYCQVFPLEVRRALSKKRSNSLLNHLVSEECSDEEFVHDFPDAEQARDCQKPSGQNIGSKRKKGHRRGPTLCVKVWTLPEGVRLPVSLNNSGFPIGKNAAMFGNFLGTLARDGILAPLTYKKWKSIPKENKDVMWHIIKLKFYVAPSSESLLLKCIRTKWRNWRCNLKRKHYDSHITEEERLADCDPRVLKEQWRFLVAFWNTEEAQAASARCKASRAKSTYISSTGSKSFARILDEESCSRDKARKRSDDVTAMGEKRRGRMHNHEPGASPSGLKEKAALKASFKEAVDAKEIAENEAATLRKKMMVMEESQKKLQEDLANMRNTVSAMQKMMSNGGLPDGLMGASTAPPSFPQGQNASSSRDDLQSPYIDYSVLYNPNSSSQQTR